MVGEAAEQQEEATVLSKKKAKLRIYIGTNTAALRSIAMCLAYIFLIIL